LFANSFAIRRLTENCSTAAAAAAAAIASGNDENMIGLTANVGEMLLRYVPAGEVRVAADHRVADADADSGVLSTCSIWKNGWTQ
jgi:hypothetical protein